MASLDIFSSEDDVSDAIPIVPIASRSHDRDRDNDSNRFVRKQPSLIDPLIDISLQSKINYNNSKHLIGIITEINNKAKPERSKYDPVPYVLFVRAGIDLQHLERTIIIINWTDLRVIWRKPRCCSCGCCCTPYETIDSNFNREGVKAIRTADGYMFFGQDLYRRIEVTFTNKDMSDIAAKYAKYIVSYTIYDFTCNGIETVHEIGGII